MADNVTINPGAGGDNIAADEIAGVKHQRVKLQYGADGSATDVSAANPLPITIISSSLTSTTYTVGNAVPATPNGNTLLLEREDVLSGLPLGEDEGDFIHVRGNANGSLWVAVDGAISATLGPSSEIVGTVIVDEMPVNSITTDTIGAFKGIRKLVTRADADGTLGLTNPVQIAINEATAGDRTLVAAPGANLQIIVYSYSFVVAADQTVTWKSGSNSKSGAMRFDALSKGIHSSSDVGVIICNTNEALVLNLANAVGVRGHLTYAVAPTN